MSSAGGKVPEQVTVQDRTLRKAAGMAGVAAVNDELARQRKKRSDAAKASAGRSRSSEVEHLMVDPMLWKLAQQIRHSKDNAYTEIEIISEQEVRLT